MTKSMATMSYLDESLVERDEVLYPITNMIDHEPLYTNIVPIRNVSHHQDEQVHKKIVCFSFFFLFSNLSYICCVFDTVR
jgi:hypothetical protein